MVIHKKRASSYGERDPWHTLPDMSASQPKSRGVCSKVGAEIHHYHWYIKGWCRSTCLTLPLTGEPQRAEGTDREHATYLVLLESSVVNTGEPARDVKEGGE
jgi:hypothetical protein